VAQQPAQLLEALLQAGRLQILLVEALPMPTIQAAVQLLYTEQPMHPLELDRLEGQGLVEQTTQLEQVALLVLQQQAQEDSVFLMVSWAEYFSRQGKEPTTPQGNLELAAAAHLQVEFLQEVVATQAALAGQVALLVVALALGQPLAALVVSAVSSSSGFKVKGQT
jgi:hypothetical protein